MLGLQPESGVSAGALSLLAEAQASLEPQDFDAYWNLKCEKKILESGW